MSNIVSIFFLIASVGIFFGFIDPQYKGLKDIREESAYYSGVLSKMRELEQVRDNLLKAKKSIPAAEVAKLEKLLPDEVDTVRLVMDMNSIAALHNLSVRSLGLANGGAPVTKATAAAGPEAAGTQTLEFSFSVTTTYEEFLSFLQDLERSLRVIDIMSIGLGSKGDDKYDFSVRARLYWLK
jgi:Tfp pilus assembly protein PilO